eukprot:TRINITY_DN45721_c0_g1_i1.p1 TRINITY_DN45721_c0_g1~~TRINITY_DN45721_c0_g1_i1.p1  ORF type:complete len:317 (+),score=76.83 TRINITY_DN45721_c0_g1_i1:79-951(+)
MAKGGTISFTLTSEGACEKEKQLELKSGGVIRIGRSPVADFSIEHRGISQYHAELRLLPDSDGVQRLSVRDLSSNGTGLKRPGAERAVCLKKDADETLVDGAQLLIPMRVKENHTGRAWIKVAIQARSGSEAKSDNGSGSGDQEEGDADAARKKFVELLLNTREISGSTTYEEAEKLLSHDSAWSGCEDQTRKECFHIFVDHLGDTGGKKKGKKKDKDKGGKKKDKDKKKGGKKRQASGSPEVRKNGSKKKGRRSASRQASGGGSASRSASRGAKRRRRKGGHSDSPGSP